ncbi:glucosamine--fructose-6-phosphate aminotransferase (isomerizing) [Luteibacter sp. Sphag1AF]|uniref:SIS domain-containing protein n=1 Tax=Luteibacter sp. Sphag1AF TaxID=2587031 RepID=UPI001610994C|nr:SIS domain-containing protein [Luteibacter sp. Sphag1AF]MBB3226713.1 glucosamine--fructose-6-phosphate aminotransferase (isomerizing) [Luteibacter sp. Sphag1AF]
MTIQPHDTLMFREAHETADVVERQLAANEEVVSKLAAHLRAHTPRMIITCARGSSDHAAMYAKYVFETQLGVVTASASPSVTSVYRAPQQLEGALYIAVSQSGKSPDLVRNAQAAKKAGAYVVAMVNVVDSPLAETADVVIPLHAGPEKSVAATKSYLGALFAILHLAARWSEDPEASQALVDLPAQLRQGWDADWSSLTDGLVDARNLFVVGRGFGFAGALEAALKFKETCGLHAEAFSAAEVKHGPMALVGPEFPVLFFAQNDDTLRSVLDVAAEFRKRGAKVWVAAPGATGDDILPLTATAPIAAPLVTVQSFYRATAALALRRGFNPDVPPHLNKVTETV